MDSGGGWFKCRSSQCRAPHLANVLEPIPTASRTALIAQRGWPSRDHTDSRPPIRGGVGRDDKISVRWKRRLTHRPNRTKRQ